MSHLVTIGIELKDKQMVLAACSRLGWRIKENAKTCYYDGTTVEGMAVHIPGWRYPLTIAHDGTVKGDNYNGDWGDPAKLNQLKQIYGVEAAKAMMRRRGRVVESQGEDGSITLTVRY